MKHVVEARYPAPAAVVLKMFADQKFHTDKLEALGYAKDKYQVLAYSSDAKACSIKIERKVPLNLPGLKGAGESTVINDEHWDLVNKTGCVVVEPKGAPLAIACVTKIHDEGTGSVVRFEWDIKAKIPLIGGTLEKFVASDTSKRTAEETEASIALLKHYR